MIFDEAGTYTIEYTATDECGNTTNVERTVIVEEPITYRTVLYTDGTFIINESSRDEAANIEAHGAATNVYVPFDPNGATNTDKYIFASANNRPWNSQSSSVISVEFGSEIQPTSLRHWFESMTNLQSVDFTNLDTKSVTEMNRLFRECSSITSIDLSSFDTGLVTDMNQMFLDCTSVISIDLSSFDTSSATAMSQMFEGCTALTTIYASSDFIVTQVTNSSYMFRNCTSIVGGAGTTYNSSRVDKTRAKIDGGVGDPGYFTAKS